jgi:glycerate 2-kinase
MRILIAADKFKGSLTQQQACEAIAEGIKRVRSDATIDLCPLADGGEGTVDAVVAATGGWIDHFDVCGPLAGMKRSAPVGFIDEGRTAIVELAAASGLLLLDPQQRDPTRTTTFGTGELLKHAADRGAKKIVLGIGGSATCDAGIGIAQAWGGAVKMINGKVYSPNDRKLCGNDLGQILAVTRYQPSFVNYTYRDRAGQGGREPILDTRGCEFVVACDVGNPLYGPDGAAHVFAPQKGATPEQVEQLDADMRKMVDRLQLHAVAEAPGAGAAGGAGFGMMAFFGASMVSGAELVMDVTRLAERIAGADLVITGEGKLDAQTLAGKAPAAVARACKAAGKRCIAFAGTIGFGAEQLLDEGLTSYFGIVDRPMPVTEAMANAHPLLVSAAARAMRAMT